MSQAILSPGTAEFAEHTRRKISRRLVPFLCFLYVIAYLDRVNLGYASLEMTKELHFSNAVYGLGAGIFFLGYALLEIPGGVMVERWSARKWICRIMVTWGFAAAVTGLVNTRGEFYWARFLLGAAEAGFFPSVAVYLTHWFRTADRGRALGGFFAANAIAQIVGSPVSAILTNVHWLGLNGWRWILILEGIPAIIVGVWALFYLTDRPRGARWLTVEEQEWITNELETEKLSLTENQNVGVLQAIFKPQILLLAAVWFLSLGASNGLYFWLPKVVQRMSGYSPSATMLLSALPFLMAWPFTLLVGWNSDRTGERRWHAAGCLLLAAGGLALSLEAHNLPIAILALSLAVSGFFARQAPIWSISSSLLAGMASAVAIGMINSIGQLGGFTGPYIVGFLTDRTGTYAAGSFYIIGSAVVAAFLMIILKTSKQIEPLK